MSLPHVNPAYLKGLTNENLQAIYERWQYLRMQGPAERNNNEFLQLTGILRMVQQTQFMRMQQARAAAAAGAGNGVGQNVQGGQMGSGGSYKQNGTYNASAWNAADQKTSSPDTMSMNTANSMKGQDLTGSSNGLRAGAPATNLATSINNVQNVSVNRPHGQNVASVNMNVRGDMATGSKTTPAFSYGQGQQSRIPDGVVEDRDITRDAGTDSLGPGNASATAATVGSSQGMAPGVVNNGPYPGMDGSAEYPKVSRPMYSGGRPFNASSPSAGGSGHHVQQSPVPSGASPHLSSTHISPAASQWQSPKPSVPSAPAASLPTPGGNHSSTSSFTPAQVLALKNQILAFKYIAANLPIPPNLQQAIFGNVLCHPNAMRSNADAANKVAASQQASAAAVNPQVSVDRARAAALVAGGVVPDASAYPLVRDAQNATHTTAVPSTIPASSSSTPAVPPSAGKSTPSAQANSTGAYMSKIDTPAASVVSGARISFGPAAVNASSSVAAPSPTTELESKSFSSCVDPNSYVSKPITYAAFNSKDNRLIIPSLLPPPLIWDTVYERVEESIALSMQNRIQELEARVVKGSDMDKRLSINERIELCSLRLLAKQKALRDEVGKTVPYTGTLAGSNLRNIFRSLKHQSLREARLTESLCLQQKQEFAERKKEKLLSQLQSILARGQGIIEHANSVAQRRQRLNKMLGNVSKRFAADDEAAYLELIDQAKDTRITHLLRQTDAYLSSLTKAVREQQSYIHDGSTAGSTTSASTKDNDNMPEAGGEKEHDDVDEHLNYYQVAHRIKEEVTQPDILVGGTLKEYQLKGLQWMLSLYNNNLNGILADEMGLGKTIQTISFITYLLERKNEQGPFLIIVPLSTLTNWSLEFEKWAPSVKIIAYKGPPQVRKSLQARVRSGDFQVLLTTFEYVIKDRPVLSKVRWLHMIIDEGHRMKNTQSKLTNTLTTYYYSRYRLILTGTPLQNNLPELWALLNFVLPKIFNSIKSFDEWFNTPFANAGGQDKMELSEEESLLVIKRLHKVLRPFLLRRLKKDVEKELPDKIEKVIKCPLSALQLRLYQQMKKHGILFVADGEKGRTGMKGLQNTVMQLKKICNHPFVFEEVEQAIDPEGTNYDLLWRAAGKFELLDRVLPKLFRTGHRTLIFFQMTQIMSIMEDYLRYRNWKYLRLDGSTKAEDRSALLADFNDRNSDIYVFLLSTRAGGLGLNLQTADTVIIFDTDWNPHQDLQAQDRAHRIGQTKEVRILRLITDKSIEENILARAQYKLDLDGKVIQAGKFDNKSTPEEREAFLRSLLEHENGDDQANENHGKFEDDELNELISRNEEELKIFREIDQQRQQEDAYGKGKPLPRLLSEDELPEIYRVDVDTLAAAAAEEENRAILMNHKRRRASISYAEPTLEELNEEDYLYSERSKRLRKRHTRGTSAYDEDDDDFASPNYHTMSKADIEQECLRAALKRCAMELYQAVYNLQDTDGRPINALFLHIPSKKLYPDYYVIIKNPISLDKIKRKISSLRYRNLQELVDDFMLMFSNARTYNEEHSEVYNDANRMEEVMRQKINDLIERNALKTYEAEELQLREQHLEESQRQLLQGSDYGSAAVDGDYDDNDDAEMGQAAEDEDEYRE
ncbi:ATP-dependent DNA helicase Snf22 [Schizosaccharomyces japonicus yFS275]|uniref:ATP-dependent DNA helicase Snf22 n=1 Tax=Schizosaccharomyces japonicus (strain yFS275 / FY16936) TaxID=402676 RepID=B6K540_SCHJY|nr:ATP-dependent DNA helicase Snf22 [Schizosaccharomyces japonicus yFS275]EEB08644.2 ATP-dependent DNA helicase Snf22 [Schizosaccharomyces japonicus yFS275]